MVNELTTQLDSLPTAKTHPRVASSRLHRSSTALLGLLVAITATVATGAGSAAVVTTAPGQVYLVAVSLTNQGISLRHEKNLHGHTLVYQRGGAVQYDVVNRGTKPYVFLIGEQQTRVIPPGRTATMEVTWYNRGSFSYKQLYHGKPVGPVGAVQVS